MSIDKGRGQAGISLVEILLVITLLSLFSGFGYSVISDFRKEQHFMQRVERARLIAAVLQNSRDYVEPSYSHLAGQRSLGELIAFVGEDVVRQSMPELLEQIDDLVDSPLDSYRVALTQHSVHVSWVTEDPQWLVFQVPFAARSIQMVPPVQPGEPEQQQLVITVGTAGLHSMAAVYRQTHVVNSF